MGKDRTSKIAPPIEKRVKLEEQPTLCGDRDPECINPEKGLWAIYNSHTGKYRWTFYAPYENAVIQELKGVFYWIPGKKKNRRVNKHE